VVILAGGLSQRFGQDKCLRKLADLPLVVHVLRRVLKVADERLIVAGSEAQRRALSRLPGLNARVVVDRYQDHSPLVGALSGFESVAAEFALLLPCDAAFVSVDVVSLLLDLCVGRSAAIPRWPNGYIEPLQAAYDVKMARDAAKRALDEGKRDMLSMIAHLRGVRYVSTLVWQQFGERLSTFNNINTVEDWRRAEAMLKKSG
jgi:molybdopterin-guanine dinucleotide biosynthesis protein A